MADVEIKLRDDGIQEILKSEAVKAECKAHADRIVSSLGDGYEADTYVGATRVNASVAAVTKQAKKDNLENNTLLKAVGV